MKITDKKRLQNILQPSIDLGEDFIDYMVPLSSTEKLMKGKTFDNRRLKAFRDAGKSIRTRKATKAEIENAIKNEKFTTKNNGVSIIVRKPKNEK